MSVRIDTESFSRSFPKSIQVPSRLLALAKWLKKIPRRALGTFDDLASEPLHEGWTGDKKAIAVLRESLGIFLKLGEGSQLALWRYGKGDPAVVMLGSEGALQSVAPNLDSFLVAWSKGESGVLDLDEDADDVESARPAFEEWLAAEGAKAKKRAVPSFKRGFNETVEQNSSKKKAKEPVSKKRIRVDLADVKKHTPKGFPLPAWLAPFAARLAKTSQSLCDGDVALVGYRHSIANDDVADLELRKKLVYFLDVHDVVSGDDMRVVLWDHGGKAPAVVAVNDASEWRTLSPDLETFLVRLGERACGIDDLDHGGDDGVRAGLVAWLESKNVKASKKKVPDVAAWIARVVEAANKKKPAPKKLGKPKGPPADMAERVVPLLRKPKDDPVVVAFCAELGIDLPSTTDDSTLQRLFVAPHGCSLGFTIKDGDKVRRFSAVRFHRGGHRFWSYARNRDVTFSEFAGPLPRGITFSSTDATLRRRFGKPTKVSDTDSPEWTDKKSGVRLTVWFADRSDVPLPEGEVSMAYLSV